MFPTWPAKPCLVKNPSYLRVRVHHDGEVALGPLAAIGKLHGEVGVLAVVAPTPRVEGRPHEQGVTEPALHRVALLHRSHDGGVETDAGVEAEVAAVHRAQSDPLDAAVCE